jgi:nucleoid-associated protein YgaU
MFDSHLDIEHAFAHDGPVPRTRVRRRRLTWLLGVSLLVVSLASQGAQALGGHPVARERSAPTAHVVRAGDTLWSIAVHIGGGRDPRLVVDAIERANGLHGQPIVPGQQLRIPTDA